MHAWYLLSQVVNTHEQAIECLERVLELQPDNVQAKERLDRIRAKQKSPSFSQSKKKSSPWQWITLGCGGLISLLCLCVLAFGFASTPTLPTQIAAILPTSLSPARLPIITIPPTWTPTLTLEPSATFEPTGQPTTVSPTEPYSIASSGSLAPITVNTIVPNQPASGNLMRVYFFDVGQGDATLIQTPDGKNILIDGGDPGTGIVQYLKSLKVQRIDYMIATHPDSDHIGGLVDVLTEIPVSKVITNGEVNSTPVYESFLGAFKNARDGMVEVKRGDTISAGSLNILVLNPVGNQGGDLNESSLVLKFKYGNTTFLMMGDTGESTEASLKTASLPIKADILKVGHHGSDSSSTPAFLNLVKPAVAIYFAGAGNPFHLPAPQTIAALNAVGAQVYGTDTNGTIVVTVDTKSYNIHASKNETRAPPVMAPPTQTIIVLPTNPPPAPVSGGIQIISLTSPIDPGAEATLTAKTVPGASCTITVYHKSGPSEAQGLEPKTAGANGMVSWTWKVGASTTPGTWRIVVTATINGQTYTQEIPFIVR